MNNLIRFTPANDLLRMQREVDQLFNNFLSRPSDSSDTENAVWAPRADYTESEDAYVFRFDVPGVPKENIEINYHEGTLSVSGERKSETAEEKQNYVRLERLQGRFFRSFSLPKAVAADRIEASYEHGVLTVRLPKAEESKPRRISVL